MWEEYTEANYLRYGDVWWSHLTGRADEEPSLEKPWTIDFYYVTFKDELREEFDSILRKYILGEMLFRADAVLICHDEESFNAIDETRDRLSIWFEEHVSELSDLIDDTLEKLLAETLS